MPNPEKEGRGIYTLAHGFPSTTELTYFVETIAKECEIRGVTGAPAKMGKHLTLLPPFYARHEAVALAAACMKATTSLAEQQVVSITVTGIGYFPPPSKDSSTEAMYLAIKLPPGYHAYITWLKANGVFDWVHSPFQASAVEPVYIPHVHVIEGENLRGRIQFFEKDLDHIIKGRTFELPPASFFIKTAADRESTWKQVIP